MVTEKYKCLYQDFNFRSLYQQYKYSEKDYNTIFVLFILIFGIYNIQNLDVNFNI